MTKAIANNKKRDFKSFFQKVGSAAMLPISLLPIAGIILGISSLLQPSLTKDILSIISISIFGILPISFAMSFSFKFSDESGMSVLNSLMIYFIFIGIQSAFITQLDSYFWKLEGWHFTSIIGFSVLNTSIFGGMAIGLTAAYIQNKWYGEIYKYISYTALISITVSFAFILIWPGINQLIYYFGEGVNKLPFGLNSFLYGFTNRLLLPFGMHSLLIPVFNHTAAGGVMIVNGEIVAQGNSQIWLAMNDMGMSFDVLRNNGGGSFIWEGNSVYITPGTNPSSYQQGFFPVMIFGFPTAGYFMQRKYDDKKTKAMIMLASITPMMTGITEPFEYLFVFTSPSLYLLHAIYTGLSFMLMDISGASIWLSSGWMFDIILFGILPHHISGMATNYWTVFYVGAIMIPLYGATFHYLYKKET